MNKLEKFIEKYRILIGGIIVIIILSIAVSQLIPEIKEKYNEYKENVSEQVESSVEPMQNMQME